MENETPIQYCRNCEFLLPEAARFCPNCSQRNHDGRYTLRAFMAELLNTLLNLDNRIFHTLGALCIPGKLTVNYFEGKHVRYYHPLRLFLLTGLALISILTVRYRQGDAYKAMAFTMERMDRNYQKKQFSMHLDSVRLAYIKELTDPIAVSAVDSLCSKVGALNVNESKKDSSNFNIAFFNIEQKGVKVATADLMELPTDSILSKYKVEGFWNRLLIARSVRMMKSANDFLISLFGNAIWMMLVMIPLLALCLKLLYIRTDHFIIEHLVFSLHVHAAMFLLFLLLVLFTKQPPPWLTAIIVALAALYPYIAMKRVYKQGYAKTGLKFFLLSLAYFVFGIISFFFLAMISFALF